MLKKFGWLLAGLAVLLLLVCGVAAWLGWFELTSTASKLQESKTAARSAGLVLETKQIASELACKDSDNAFLALQPVLKTVEKNEDLLKFHKPEELLKAFDKHPGLLDQACEALKRPRYDSQRDWSKAFQNGMPELLGSKAVAKGLVARMNKASADGDFAAAQTASESLGNLVNLINQDPLLISMLVSIAIDQMRARAVFDAAGAHLYSPEWRSLLTQYVRDQAEYDLSKSLRAETTVMLATLDKVDPWGRNWNQTAEWGIGETGQHLPTGPGARDASIAAYLDVTTRTYKQLVATKDDLHAQKKALHEIMSDLDKDSRKSYEFVKMVSPVYSGCIDAVERTAKIREVFQLTENLFAQRARTGQFPSKLSSKLPPDFRYKAVGSGFALYWIGVDGKDSGFRKEPGFGKGESSSNDDYGVLFAPSS